MVGVDLDLGVGDVVLAPLVVGEEPELLKPELAEGPSATIFPSSTDKSSSMMTQLAEW